VIQRILTAAYFSATKPGNLLCCKQIKIARRNNNPCGYDALLISLLLGKQFGTLA